MTKETIIEILKDKENFIRVHTQDNERSIMLFEGDYPHDLTEFEFSQVFQSLKESRTFADDLPFVGYVSDKEYKLK